MEWCLTYNRQQIIENDHHDWNFVGKFVFQNKFTDLFCFVNNSDFIIKIDNRKLALPQISMYGFYDSKVIGNQKESSFQTLQCWWLQLLHVNTPIFHSFVTIVDLGLYLDKPVSNQALVFHLDQELILKICSMSGMHFCIKRWKYQINSITVYLNDFNWYQHSKKI